MTTPTDSKFFFNDCSCLKKEITSEFFIQCNECIESGEKWENGRACSCRYRTVRQLNCSTCSDDRDRLDEMQSEFDNLILDLSATVKSFSSCDNDVRAIVELSKQMRKCNNRLLSRIDTSDMDRYEHDIPDAVIEDDDDEDEDEDDGNA